MADHTNQNIISQVLIGNTTYEIHDKAAIHDIEDLGLGGNPLVFKGTVATRAALDDVASPVAGWVYLVTEDQSEWVYDGTKWELMDSAMVGEHTHDIIVPTKEKFVDASKVVTEGSVVAGSAATFTQGTFNAGGFEQGTDTWETNTPTVIDTTKFSGGSFTPGTDSFTANEPTKIDVNKFSAGSTSLNNDGSYTAQKLSYTAPSLGDGFYKAGSAASMTEGSATLTGASNPSWGASVNADGVLSFSWNEGSHGSVNYVAPKFTPNTPAVIDVSKFSAGSASISDGGVAFPTLSYTAPSLGAGFYTAGSAAKFTQGTDTFTPASLGVGFYTVGKAATFEQGEDKWTAPSHADDTFTQNTPTAVTLPTFETISNLWSGTGSTTVTSGKPEAAE